MAAPFLLGLVLVASVATAGGDDGAWELLPHLQLPGTPNSRGGHASDAPLPQGQLMDIMSTGGCGRFATLVAAMPNAGDVLQQLLLSGGGGGGLTVFCPDDKAVAAFEPTFRALADSDRLDVLLRHAAAARYDRALLAPFAWVEVRTLGVADTETVLIRDRGDSIRLWLGPTWPRDGQAATVTKAISSSEHPLVLYIVDAVLLRRQKPDGGDKAAACGGQAFCWLLGCIIPVVSEWLSLIITDELFRARA